jgi:hypothetical protein
MPDVFDPYRKWLGIPPAEQPPNHYRLLGLGLFEDDADTIANAADRQMAHVRNFQTGPRSALSQQVLNELAAARLTLLDTAKKSAYDTQLRTKLSAVAPAAEGAGQGRGAPAVLRPMPLPPVVPRAAPPATVAPIVVVAGQGRGVPPAVLPRAIAQPSVPQFEPGSAVSQALRRRRRFPTPTLVIALGVAALALVVVVFNSQSTTKSPFVPSIDTQASENSPSTKSAPPDEVTTADEHSIPRPDDELAQADAPKEQPSKPAPGARRIL